MTQFVLILNGNKFVIIKIIMLEKLRPTLDHGCLFEELDPERVLYEAARHVGYPVEGVSFDLDGTVLPHFADRLSARSLSVIKGFVELVPGGINSNAGC